MAKIVQKTPFFACKHLLTQYNQVVEFSDSAIKIIINNNKKSCTDTKGAFYGPIAKCESISVEILRGGCLRTPLVYFKGSLFSLSTIQSFRLFGQRISLCITTTLILSLPVPKRVIW